MAVRLKQPTVTRQTFFRKGDRSFGLGKGWFTLYKNIPINDFYRLPRVCKKTIERADQTIRFSRL